MSGHIHEAYGALISAEQWLLVRLSLHEMTMMFMGSLQDIEEGKDTLLVINDGIKFVSNFAGVIAESTPHLYLSALQFSPSKSMLVTQLGKRFSQITEMRGKHEDWPLRQHVLKGHTDCVWSVAFSPDGRYIVSGSEDNTIRVWGAQMGVQVGKTLKGHTGLVLSVAFSPDGRYIVSGSSDETLQIWDVQTGAQVGKPLQGHTDIVRSVAFSSNGRQIVSSSYDNTI